MTSNGNAPSRRPAADRRREIADAALRVIAAHGLGRFTTLAIAREVGVTDGALFRHFRSKQEIVDAAIDRVEELLFEGFPPEEPEPIARLGLFFRRRVAVVRAQPGISRLVVSEELVHAASASGVARVEAMRARSMGFVRACLDDASGAGLLADGLGPEEASVVVLGAILALAHTPGAPHREPLATFAPRVWSALEDLLRGRPPAPRSAGRRPPRSPGRPIPPGEKP